MSNKNKKNKAEDGLRKRGAGATEDSTEPQELEMTQKKPEEEKTAAEQWEEAMKRHADYGSTAKKKQKPWFIRLTTWKYFKLLPWACVGATPFAAFLAIPMIVDNRFEPWTVSYFCVIFFGMWNALMLMYNFIMASVLEPGFVTDNYYLPHSPPTGKYLMVPPPRPAAMERDKLRKMEELAKEKGVEVKDLTDKDLQDGECLDAYDIKLFYAPRFCHICNVWKPPRSHHCSVTGKCVMRMDHFCPFTGNVIAIKNHGHFILMYTWAAIGLIYATYHIFMIIFTQTRLMREQNPNFSFLISPRVEPAGTPQGKLDLWSLISMTGSRFTESNIDLFNTAAFYFGHSLINTLAAYRLEGTLMMVWGVLAIVENMVHMVGWFMTGFMFFACVFIVVVSACGGPVFYFISINVTALEYNVVRLNEYIEIAPQVYCPIGLQFYKQNTIFENYKQILGENWMWRLFLPIRGKVDVYRYGYEPPTSHAGVQQLHFRIQQFLQEGVQQPVKSYDELGITPTAMDLADGDRPDTRAAMDGQTKQGSV